MDQPVGTGGSNQQQTGSQMSPNELASLDEVVQRAGTTKLRAVVLEEVREKQYRVQSRSRRPEQQRRPVQKLRPDCQRSQDPGKPVTAEGGKKKPDSLVSLWPNGPQMLMQPPSSSS